MEKLRSLTIPKEIMNEVQIRLQKKLAKVVDKNLDIFMDKSYVNTIPREKKKIRKNVSNNRCKYKVHNMFSCSFFFRYGTNLHFFKCN